jgi:hypothetical protein
MVHGRPARSLHIRCSSCSSYVLASRSLCLLSWVVFVAWSSQTIHNRVLDGPWRGGGSGPSRTIRFSRYTIGGSGGYFVQSATYPQTVRLGLTDSPAPPCGWSARCTTDCLSSSLLDSCFLFALSCDLFLGLVGPLWLCDLGKLVWESMELILGHNQVHLFGEEFLWAPIRSPLSSRLIGSSAFFLRPTINSAIQNYHKAWCPSISHEHLFTTHGFHRGHNHLRNLKFWNFVGFTCFV